MTETEFMRSILEAITGTKAPRSTLEAANAHKMSVVEGMLSTAELGDQLDNDEYALVDNITHNMLSTLITAQLETNQLLRVLIERTPEKVPFLPPKADKASPESKLLSDILGTKP